MSVFKNIKKIISSEFFKHSAALLSSNAIAQLTGILIYPVITRLYSPEAFGEFNWLLSVTGVLSLFCTGRYGLAIVLSKSKQECAALFQLCMFLNLVVFFLSFLIILTGKTEIAACFDRNNLLSLLPFIPFILLLSGLWETLDHFFIHRKQYYAISVYNIMQSVGSSALKCLFGIKGFFQPGLIWGTILGRLVAIIAGVVACKSWMKELAKINLPQIKQVAKTYANFPKFEMPHSLLNMSANNLPVLLLSFYFGMEEIGLFSLAMILGFRPVFLFTSSIHQVLFRRASERVQKKEKIKGECVLFCKMCLTFILPAFVFILFIPGEVFAVLFGSKWAGVDFYLKLLLPGLFMSVIVASLAFVPDIFFKQKITMNIEIAHVILKAAALLSGIYFRDFNLAIILYCCVIPLIYTIRLIWYFHLIREYESSIARP
ncbi:MAG: lipopolysaccharide biosynthesis protein [Dysgonamonadaceae bacterium]|jgi:O-antigen/teichoic acid export membrane protein|nr:lipopolysaccharide biosynthesis protein [Dysgonamonadaceae bacterium]